jgi:hypothetical protein
MSAATGSLSLANEDVLISFDRTTGALVGLRSLPQGREYLKTEGAGGPFAVWHDFTRPYRFVAANPGEACNKPPEPAELASGCFLPAGLADSSVQGKTARLSYRDASSALVAELTVALDGAASRWTLKVTNTGASPRELMASFPWWRGIGLEREAGGRMLAMNQAGYVGSLWHWKGGLYGLSSQQSAQLGCLYERDTGDCFGFYVDDPDCGAKEILFLEPDVQVRWFPPSLLQPGESRTWPTAVLMLYRGTWKRTAAAYGDWFRRTIKPDPVPDWVMRNESYGGAWAEKRGDEYDTRPGGGAPDIPPNAMDSFDELPMHYLRIPMETIEFAFTCRQSQRPADRPDGTALGPQPRRHTDGWNAIREDLGGMASLRRGVEAVHRMGRRITLYVEGLIVPDDSELFEHIPAARDWVAVNADGTTNGPYTKHRYVHMCPGCVQWQDHVVDMCVRLMREAGIDGIRLDSLGFYFWPCHNPAHHHESPYDYNRWVQELYAKVARAVRAVKPDALLSTEAPADFNHRHFNHSLHQIFTMEMPYALHTGAGVAGAPLQLQPLWWNPGAEDAPWLAAYPAVADTFASGDASLFDPASYPAGMWCRRVRGAGEELVIGGRALAKEETPGRHCLAPIGERTRTEIMLLLDYKPEQALIYDLQARTLEPLAWKILGRELRFSVQTSWFVALLRRKKGPALCLMELPDRLAAGSRATLRIRAPGVNTARDGTLRIAGVAGMEALAVKVPGEIDIGIPAGTRPAWYRAELSGAGICPTIALFKVTP